jgi:hypothetical protein
MFLIKNIVSLNKYLAPLSPPLPHPPFLPPISNPWTAIGAKRKENRYVLFKMLNVFFYKLSQLSYL